MMGCAANEMYGWVDAAGPAGGLWMVVSPPTWKFGTSALGIVGRAKLSVVCGSGGGGGWLVSGTMATTIVPGSGANTFGPNPLKNAAITAT